MRLFIVLCLFVSGSVSPVQAQVTKMTSWKKEAALVRFALKRKNWRSYRTSRVIERDLIIAFKQEMRSRFSSFRYAPARIRKEMQLMKWRWNGRSSRANARYAFWFTMEIKARKTVLFRLYAFVYNEIDSGSVLMKSFVGAIPFRVTARIGRQKLRYTNRRVRAHYRRAFRGSASRLLNLFFYNQGQRNRTQCSVNKDCGHRMLACDAGKCRKKRKSDLSSQERTLLSRRRSCQTYVHCYADEYCNSDGVCEDKTKPKPKKKCEGGTVICQNNAEWQCRADGSGWYSLKACVNGCNANTGRCKNASSPQSRSQPAPQTRPTPRPVPRQTVPLRRRTPVIPSCKNDARRCGKGRVEICRDGKWYLQQRCDYGCSKGKCLPKSRYQRFFVGFEVHLGGVFLGDSHQGRYSLMGGAHALLNFYTNVGIFGVGGGWSGGGVSSLSALNAAMQDVAFFGMWYRHQNLRWLSFSAGLMWHGQRIPGDGVGFKQSDLIGPYFQLEGQLVTFFLSSRKNSNFIGLRAFAGCAFPFRIYAPGQYLPTTFAPISVFGGLKLVWSSPLL